MFATVELFRFPPVGFWNIGLDDINRGDQVRAAECESKICVCVSWPDESLSTSRYSSGLIVFLVLMAAREGKVLHPGKLSINNCSRTRFKIYFLYLTFLSTSLL